MARVVETRVVIVFTGITPEAGTACTFSEAVEFIACTPVLANHVHTIGVIRRGSRTEGGVGRVATTISPTSVTTASGGVAVRARGLIDTLAILTTTRLVASLVIVASLVLGIAVASVDGDFTIVTGKARETGAGGN